MIIACVSTYRDDHLLQGCIESAVGKVDAVLVADGPWGKKGGAPHDVVTSYGETGRREGTWESDAAKRSYMLGWARHFHKGYFSRRKADELWVLWLDGDELLLWGEHLRAMCTSAEEQTGGGGFPLRLVELDGSVVDCRGKVIRADAVRRYLHSSYQVETPQGIVVALPNVQICTAGGMPVKPEGGWDMPPEEMDAYLAKHRPPLAGEPHLLHRSALRNKGRADTVRRGSDVEGDWFKDQIAAQGLEGVE